LFRAHIPPLEAFSLLPIDRRRNRCKKGFCGLKTDMINPRSGSSPDRGFFPGKASGVYLSSDGESAMVLSRGLGSSSRIPRINNMPEVVVVDLIPQT